MKHLEKLKICNWALLIFCLLILTSSIQLEATGSRGLLPVWLHVFIGLLFSLLVILHIYLHFKWCNWFARFNKLKKPVTRILWYLFLATIILCIATFIHWLISNHHSILGGVHGKIGFLMLAVGIGHILKRIKFFKTSKK